MTRDELEHAIRAACEVARDDTIYVFGSQAILGQFPDAPPALRQSVEVDVAPRSRLDRIDHIDGSLGELSQFHATFGFYVHGLSLEAARLPTDWQARVVPVRVGDKTGLCLEAHDLAASKLAAFRDKDRDFVRVLLAGHLIEPAALAARIGTLDIPEEESARRVRWVEITAHQIERGGT